MGSQTGKGYEEMAVNIPDKRAWQYTNNDGTKYRVLAESDLVSQAKQGGAAADGTETLPPKGFKPRVAYVFDSVTNTRRAVVVYSITAPLWTTPNTTILLNLDSVQTSFAGGGPDNRRAEQMPRKFNPRKAA